MAGERGSWKRWVQQSFGDQHSSVIALSRLESRTIALIQDLGLLQEQMARMTDAPRFEGARPAAGASAAGAAEAAVSGGRPHRDVEPAPSPVAAPPTRTRA